MSKYFHSMITLTKHNHWDCYYSAFPTDRRVIKIVVFVILLLEAVQSAALTHCTFQSLITGFADPSLLNVVGTLWCSIPLITGLSAYMDIYARTLDLLIKLLCHIMYQPAVAFITQGFYCHRVSVLTRSKYAVTVISMVRTLNTNLHQALFDLNDRILSKALSRPACRSNHVSYTN